MDLIFNELSTHHKVSSQTEARKLMVGLLHTYKKAKKFNFRKMRINKSNFYQLDLSENYMIADWFNDHCSVRRTHMDALRSSLCYPFIAEGDENIEDCFIQNNYYLNTPTIQELHMKAPEGLAVAFLYGTLSISLATHEIWEKINIELLERTEEGKKCISARHISCPEHLESHGKWIESNRLVELIETDILPKNKEINLRDDHGKDVLKKFANKLINSPYVVKIINSLPFNAKEKRFIKNIFPDGKIELVLIWTDEGFGLIVQTTGRNLQETKKIEEKIVNFLAMTHGG